MGLYRKDDNWFIDYYVSGRRKREKIGASKKLAERVLAKRKTEIVENRYLDIRKEKKFKFTQLAETFLNDYSRLNHRAHLKYVSFVKNLTAFFGERYLSEINSLMVEKYKSERLNKIKPVSVNRELDTLKSMFNRAIEWGMLNDSPAKNVKKFAVDDRRVRFLTIAEIHKLLDATSDDLRGIVVLALNTGMRKGEIFRLKWEYFDLKNAIIHLPVSLSKNKRSREIPMNSVVVRTLEDVKTSAAGEYVFPNRQDGRPLTDIRKSFAAALEKAGIANFRFHDLRHTFCSQLVSEGVDIYTVMELAGHSSIKMTMRYAHLSPNQKRDAVEKLGRRMDTFWTLGPEKGLATSGDFVSLPSEN